MEYELHPADEDDKESIRSLNKRCYRDVVERQFGGWDDEFHGGLFDRKWEESQYQKIIHKGEMSGILVVETHRDHVFLSEIQIDPDQQGRGFGTQVISDVVDEALKNGLPVRLRVLLQSPAKALYERLGFVVTGEIETHYLMEKSRDEPRLGQARPLAG